jgi:hypothetical protein
VKFAAGFLIMALLVPSALAHVPLIPSDNEEIDSAYHISDPGKSWAFYGDLNRGTVHYYSFNIESGERIYLSLLKSTNPEEKSFTPKMLLMIPGQEENGSAPSFVDVPTDYVAFEIEEMRPISAFYEPFGPGSYYRIAELNTTATNIGVYYLAVYDPDNGGHYSLAIGYREEFSLMERITTPLRLISVYQWEGQSLAFILAPMCLAAIVGLVLVWHSNKRTTFMSTTTMAGMLFIGSSATILSQIIFNMMRVSVGSEVAISLALTLISAIFGVAALRLSRGQARLMQRIALAIIGTCALLAGFGLIIGPILGIAASVSPPRVKG